MPRGFLEHVKHVHCVGIGGIGVSAIAKFCLAQGIEVTGSDLNASLVTEDLTRRGVTVHIGESQAEFLSADVDLLVYSEAIPEAAAERVAATERGIRQMGHFDFLGELSKEYATICVTGTHGKSTTTAMVGKIFEEAGLDPTVFVGSLVPGWEEGNFRMGKGEWLVIEGDEYKQKMVKLWPNVTVITNVEKDHLDVYRDFDHILETFAECASKTHRTVWVNADDRGAREVVNRMPRGDRWRVQYYAGDKSGALADLVAEGRTVAPGEQSFAVRYDDAVVPITLHIPGVFNMMNAAAASAVAFSCSIFGTAVTKALGDFPGIWRRFERVGEWKGATVISDYAHHPTAVQATIQAAREFFPGRRLVVLFEPHQHSRTKELFAEFTHAFAGVDVLVLSEIYRVAGRTEDDAVSSEQLLEAVRGTKDAPGIACYAPDLQAADELLRKLVKEGDIVVVMGAGKVDEVARRLV